MNRAAPSLTAGGMATFGMRVLLASLTMLFAASLLGYVVTRRRLGDALALPLPGLLWGSTAVLLASAVVVEVARRRLWRRDVAGFRMWITIMGGLAIAFMALQIPALGQLLHTHRTLRPEGNPLLGFVFFLVLLHALHVVGGLVPLALLLRRAWGGGRPLVPDDHGGVRLFVRYWHFLDIVWVVMLAVFLLA